MRTHAHERGKVAVQPGRKAVAVTAAACLLGGCSHLPDANIRYYLAKSKVKVAVTRVVFCNDNFIPIVSDVVTPVVTHSADRDEEAKARWIKLSGLQSPIGDTEVKFEFFDDGRLKSVNSSFTGQGESVVKAAVTLAATLRILKLAEGVPALEPAPDQATCQLIARFAPGKEKLVTLNYVESVDIDRVGKVQPIPPDAMSQFLAKALERSFGGFCMIVGEVSDPNKVSVPVTHQPPAGAEVLKAREPGWATLVVGVSLPDRQGQQTCHTVPAKWSGSVMVAHKGREYDIPLPRPVLFGKQTFEVSFAESGALTRISYSAQPGAAQALGALNTLAGLPGGDQTTAQKKTELKDQADLIYEQNRLAKCLADPTTCAK